ncbi:RICIN domain-containing protein [Streptomyces sp. RKAG293]|uniref:RICIN domain-containing protein n=1 Tax=Streptomyces sp. RKAG293 TaxID=2893403 RepID=UPI0020333911|nr:RICIN domain-containing protein [Streptomyces sp. RKAG293]MCM2422641.1 RICIN domain-containing protein [Streptomyces sp. RKAG293]
MQAATGTPGLIGGGTGRRPLRRIAALAVLPAALCALGAFQVPANAATGYIGDNILRNIETGRCLDSNASGAVYTMPCSLPVKSNQYQLWEPQLVFRGSSDVVIVKNVATQRCLTLNGSLAGVHTESCDSGHSDQKWSAKGSGWDKINLEITYARGRGGFISVDLDSNRQGNAYASEYNGSGFQRWKFGY